MSDIDDLTSALCAAIARLPLSDRVDALNAARAALHEVSPFAAEPVDCVLWVPAEQVQANGWNPNRCAPPEMVALRHSVAKYGYTMPIVTSETDGVLTVTDGFHRKRVGTEDEEIRVRTHGYLPVSVLAEMSRQDQISATILHNKARGEHSVEKEIAIVAELDQAGWSPEELSRGLVKSNEELIRLRQNGGVASLLANNRYDKAWDWEDKK